MNKTLVEVINLKNGYGQFTYRISGKCDHNNFQWINPLVKLCNKCNRIHDIEPESGIHDWGNWNDPQEWSSIKPLN